MSSARESFLFALLLERAPESRAECLDTLCDGNLELRRRLQALLDAHDRQQQRATVASVTERTPEPVGSVAAPDEVIGQTLGRYKLRDLVGEGGCGTVYVAEQTEPVRRLVAVKVVKLGMDTREVIARFEAERQALAMMDHPNIAKVLDAGATETGRPYFVMELVRGARITDYCDQARLSTRERLELFIKVCHGIQHAHQKGIIHRDIKPSNILVSLHDGVAVPKVIDFGIAKATGGRLTDATVYTQLHQFMGTPAYMSPEQAEMSALDIDTRSDIYSLGVLLYQLLTSRTPFDGQELLASGIDAMRRTIREKEPARPSTRLAALEPGELTTTAQRRSVDTSRLVHEVRGDLDWIVMKCLEKDRQRRYESANGLAADVRRHLNNEPVVARPASAAYRFQKAFRRNRLVFSAAAAVAVALIAGIIVSTWLGIRARRMGALAEARLIQSEKARRESEAIQSFLTRIFFDNDRDLMGARSSSVLDSINAAAARLDRELADQPERQAEMQILLAAAYGNLLKPEAGLPLVMRARDYFLQQYGPDHENTIKADYGIANGYYQQGRKEDARKVVQSVLERARRTRGPEDRLTVTAMYGLTISHDVADPVVLPGREEVVRLARKVMGSNDPGTLKAMMALQDAYAAAGDAVGARELGIDLTRQLWRRFGATNPGVLKQLRRAENALYEVGYWRDALELRGEYTRLPDAEFSVLQPALLAWFKETNGFHAVTRIMLARARTNGTPEFADRAAKAFCLLPGPDPTLLPEARSLARHAVAAGTNSSNRGWFQLALGMAEYRSGNWAAAEAALAAAERQTSRAGLNQARCTTMIYQSMCLARMGRTAEARARYDDAVAILKPFPEDEFAPLAGGDENDLVNWVSLQEAAHVLGLAPPADFSAAAWLEMQEARHRRRPDELVRAAHLALARLWRHDDEAHREICRDLFARVAGSRKPSDHELAARAYLLQPKPEPELLGLAREAAGRAVSLAGPAEPRLSYFQLDRAMAVARSGTPVAADPALTEVIESTRIRPCRALALAARARVRWLAGRKDEARADLVAAEQMGVVEPDEFRVNSGLRRSTHLAVHLALREARGLIRPR